VSTGWEARLKISTTRQEPTSGSHCEQSDEKVDPKGHRTGVDVFRDRTDAGERLAQEVQRRALDVDLILALPRGGVPVAAPVARAQGLPLDVLLVRKMGLPASTELAMGAIASGGLHVLNQDVLDAAKVDEETVRLVMEREEAELARREELYRGNAPASDLSGRRVLLVDDGLATGATMRVAVRAVAEGGARAIYVAVPVSAPEILKTLEAQVDELICLLQPTNFQSVGSWYQNFEQVDDEEVREVLGSHRQATGSSPKHS